MCVYFSVCVCVFVCVCLCIYVCTQPAYATKQTAQTAQATKRPLGGGVPLHSVHSARGAQFILATALIIFTLTYIHLVQQHEGEDEEELDGHAHVHTCTRTCIYNTGRPREKLTPLPAK
jgi:hypothetical protein